VAVGAHSGTKLLQRANRARQDPSSATPFDLWLLADRASPDDSTQRAFLYGHALIHAGYIVDAETGEPLVICSVCDEHLG
jgi:hypothetical protein